MRLLAIEEFKFKLKTEQMFDDIKFSHDWASFLKDYTHLLEQLVKIANIDFLMLKH